MSQSDSTKVPWASLAVVATFVSGTLIVPKAFDLLRPPEKERAQQFSGADLEVDARLWEDPFGAVRRHEAERVERCKNPAAASKRECDARQRDERRSPQALRAHLDGNADGQIDAQSTLLIAVLVPGNPFVGAEEARRRTRFALIAGLQAEGYFPDSAEQIGLMQVPLAPIASAAPLSQLTSSPATRAAAAAANAASAAEPSASSGASTGPVFGGDMLQMPYELLSRSRNVRISEDAPAAAAAARVATQRDVAATAAAPSTAASAATAREPFQRVAVVWVDEAALPGPKLDGVARLLDTVMACREQVCPRLAVIGPSSSDGLNLMLHGLEAALARRTTTPEAIDASLANGYRLLGRAHYLAPGATISDEDLPLLRRYGYSVQEFLTAYFTGIVPERARMGAAEREVQFQRTIGADNTVATLLAGEVLQRLPTTDKRRIVTIVESDSIYARGLEQRLRHLLGFGSQVSRIDQAYFFRGIDGVTSRDGAGDRPPPATKSKGSEADAVEWPEARDQLDYLRRMAEELKASEGIATEKGGGPIGAIGIFANDVHDKLLVLQALHDTFPDKVFFTTDMDARYVHPRVLPFTRNLVVASSLPLKMPPLLHAAADGERVKGARQVQEGTPPLRDAYQTATYLSARLAACTSACAAVQGALQAAIESPSVYEIGRSGAVAIAGYDATVQQQQRAGVGTPATLAAGLLAVLAGLLLWPGTPALQQARARLAAPGPVSPLAPHSPLPQLSPSMPAPAGSMMAPPMASRTASVPVSWMASLLTTLYGLWFGFAAASVQEAAAPGSLGFHGALAWAALAALAAATLSPTGQVWLMGGRDAPWARWRRPGTALLLGLALGGAWALVEPALPGQGEPLRWLEGISGWPSHFLHLAAFLVVLVSLDLAWHRAGEVMRAEDEWLGWHQIEPELSEPAGPTHWPQRLRAWLHRHALLSNALPEPGSVDFRVIWRRFQQVNEPAPRLVRVAFWYVLTVAGATLLFVLLTGRWVPEVPVRGAEHRALILAGLIASLAALPALVLAVADATLSTCRLLLALGRGRTVYPPEVVARFARDFGPEHRRRLLEPLAAAPGERGGAPPEQRSAAPAERSTAPAGTATAAAGAAAVSAPAAVAEANRRPEHSLLDDWIDMQLIARQTQAVAPLIVAPFVVLGLLVAARSRLFDSWAVTWPLALTAALYLFALVGLAVALKLGAERLRSDALARMRADLLWLTGAGPERAKLVEPMKQLIADVEKNSTGAFAPMLEQPLVAALMVPLGSAGGVQIFDRLLLAR